RFISLLFSFSYLSLEGARSNRRVVSRVGRQGVRCRMGACCCKKKKDGTAGTKTGRADLNSTKTKKSGKQAESPPIDQTDDRWPRLRPLCRGRTLAFFAHQKFRAVAHISLINPLSFRVSTV
ncbi:hypothetical protein PRIPAC_75495, partial [Pristionchus pacificus]